MKKHPKRPIIGTLSEKSLHASLKKWYAKSGDLFETPYEGYVIDIIRGKLLIEIQTGNFSSFKNKIKSLSSKNKIIIIFPIPLSKWIIKKDLDGKIVSKRKSPKSGTIEEIFSQLIYMPDVIIHPNIKMIVPLIKLNEIWLDDGKGSWRRKKWSKFDQELISIENEYMFNSLLDYQNLISPSVKKVFTTLDLSQNNNITRKLAQKMCYSLRKMNLIDLVGKQGKSNLYEKINLETKEN